MIDLHKIVSCAVAPVRVRPPEAYVDLCSVNTDAAIFEVVDAEDIIAAPARGSGVINNPGKSNLTLMHLGIALIRGAWKINNLPSACDLIISNEDELIIAELTESNPRSISGVSGSHNPGKMEKAKKQLKSTILYIDKSGVNMDFKKRTAIFFFRFPKVVDKVAARSLNAFMMRPTLRTVTVYSDTDCPEWEFRNHPYPLSYTVL